jgi:hypothetical protein
MSHILGLQFSVSLLEHGRLPECIFFDKSVKSYLSNMLKKLIECI